MSALSKLSNQDFDTKFALILFAVIVAVYVGISFAMWEGELDQCKYYGYHDTGVKTGTCGDTKLRLEKLYEWDVSMYWQTPRHFATYTLLNWSADNLNSMQILPFISSILLLVIVYFLTVRITKTNYAGLIAVLLVIVSPIFHKYDSSFTYPTFWATLFFAGLLASTYRIAWGATAPLLIVSVALKILGVLMYLPTIGFVYFSDVKHRKWVLISIVGSVAVMVGAGMFLFPADIIEENLQIEVNLVDFAWWLGMWSIELQNDRVSLYLLFFAFIGLFVLRKEKMPYATALIACIFLVMIQPAIISGFTSFTNEEYRQLPLVVLIAISVAYTIPNLSKLQEFFQRFSNLNKATETSSSN